jgi:hypothetical protein
MPTEENTEIDLFFWAGSGLAEERLRNPFKTTQELEILSKWYCKNKKKFGIVNPAEFEPAPF